MPIELRVREATITRQHRSIVGTNSLQINHDLHVATERAADQLHNPRSLDRLFSPDVARQKPTLRRDVAEARNRRTVFPCLSCKMTLGMKCGFVSPGPNVLKRRAIPTAMPVLEWKS
jgi:hypothetical protein